MSHRIEQLESTLRRVIGQILAEGLSDPRLRGLVSVTSVKVTEDRHTAVVNVSVMPAEHEQGSVRALRHAARHIRHEVGRRVEARVLPHLDFKLDRSLKKQAEVMQAIHDAMSATTPPDASADDGDTQ